MKSSTWDAIVVGAGPAGASAAGALARGGLRVAILEKERLPRYKTCGGGLVPRVREALPPGFDLSSVVEHECPVAELRIEGRTWTLNGDAPWVSMAMRSDFDAALVDHARAGGAELIAPATLRGLRSESDRVIAETTAGTHCAPFLVAADGATGPTARLASWPPAPPGIPALEWELTVTPEVHARFAGIARFDFDAIAGGYAWVFPKSNHLSVGILSTRRPAPSLVGRLESTLGDWGLADCPAERHGFLIPVRPRVELTRGRVLLSGDAAGLADPITAEGISAALISGAAAAQAILAGAPSPEAVARHYRRMVHQRLVSDLRWARLLAGILYRPGRARRFLFERLGRTLTHAVGEVIAGRTSYRRLLCQPRSYLKLGRRLLQRSS